MKNKKLNEKMVHKIFRLSSVRKISEKTEHSLIQVIHPPDDQNLNLDSLMMLSMYWAEINTWHQHLFEMKTQKV